jgi:hypothetical protein
LSRDGLRKRLRRPVSEAAFKSSQFLREERPRRRQGHLSESEKGVFGRVPEVFDLERERPFQTLSQERRFVPNVPIHRRRNGHSTRSGTRKPLWPNAAQRLRQAERSLPTSRRRKSLTREYRKPEPYRERGQKKRIGFKKDYKTNWGQSLEIRRRLSLFAPVR